MKRTFKNIKKLGFDIDWTLYFPKKDRRIPEKFCELIAKKAKIDSEGMKKIYYSEISKYKGATELFNALTSLSPNEIQEAMQEGIECLQDVEGAYEDRKLVSLLNKLKSKYPLFIVTGNREALAKKKLSTLGVEEGLFSESIYGGMQFQRQDGSAFYEIGRRMNCPLEEICYVGDREKVDIIPANKLGIKTIKIDEKREPTIANELVTKIYDIENLLL